MTKSRNEIGNGVSRNLFARSWWWGQVVSVLASCSDDPSLNPIEIYFLFCVYVRCLKRMKIIKKKPRIAQIKNFFHIEICKY